MTMMPLFQHVRFGAAAMVLALPLVACEREGDPMNLSLEHSVPSPQSRMEALAPTSAGTQTQGPSQPLVTLPPQAGAVASVRSHGYVNGFRQDILLTGSVVASIRNSITVLARTTRQQTLDEAVPLYQPTEAAIRSELGSQFPRVTMKVIERESSNGYGPYGLALGRGDKDIRCLYMWQWVDQNRVPPSANVDGPLSVRVRLCQRNTTFDAMAALVDHLSIGQDPTQIASAGADDPTHVVTAPPEVDADKPHVKRPRHHRSKPLAKRRTAPDVADADVIAAPVASPPAGPPTALSSDLPPQAYLGPKAAGTPKAN